MIKILLVDNDPLQAFVHKATLEKRFGTVLRAHDAAEALCLVEQPGFSADLALVVCSHPLPGLNCADFIAELRARLPRLNLLVVGHAIAELAEDPAGNGQIQCLPLPFNAPQVIRTIVQMLDTQKASAA